MAGLATWYNSQYSTWNRTRRLHAQPFIARTDTITSRRAPRWLSSPNPEASMDKKSDTLFGPNIGIVSGGPAWTERHERGADELTPESYATTTTLQALVNLKRPTLRLTPLEIAPADDPDHADSQHHHGLEFEYDCDAPKCGISHPLAGKPDPSGLCKFLIYESVVDGGFGRVLKLEDGVTLELGRFEPRADADKEAAGEAPADAEQHATEDVHAKGARKRFTHFNFRMRTHGRAAVGPALAVVDAEAPAHAAEGEDEGAHASVAAKDEEPDVGVKVVIRLAALDEEGKELPSANEQVTYLHVVRFGAPPPPEVDGAAVEDKRPWVVKVVKREAIIGPHTFHLHEIYGLSANSTTASHAQPTPPPASVDQHVYPPVAAPANANAHEDEPSSECLLCLSSPREVVLLPCRHLVACRECAVNMIEFGAGGTIVHQESETTATAGTEGAAGENAAPAPPTADGAVPGSEANAPQPTPRRKRKAKGWFCPVCRQPYTSMLRITTTPPSKEGDEKNRDSMSTEAQVDVLPALPAAATAPTVRGSLASLARPGFLRAFRPGAPQPDVERGQVQAA
ncbi:uncharacterized protein B0H18DRAFT_985359 [Fomitopsis serialis]|uniref:uncharacterized protein n=1 Tax=Fomitopsis serialis TaxID=139415 RepID=UPI0020087723|nr:uncharacterized protein B0H18DRAFT_985359 [Neoantrodia serialis]KAH9933058.1 hypothetical protein B0H18DRAFT_985359 [Neoantrodia serialis]